MKNISNWSILGMVLGGLFSLLSAIRYYLLFPDFDKALAYISIGACIFGISVLYHLIIKLRGEIERENIKLETKISGLQDFTKELSERLEEVYEK